MKNYLALAVAALAFAQTATAAQQDLGLPLPGSEINARIDVVTVTETGWKVLPIELTEMDPLSFAGTFNTPSGNAYKISGDFEAGEQSVNYSVAWGGAEADAPGIPSTFVRLTLILPMEDAQNVTIVSEKQKISVEKLLAKESNWAAVGNVREVTMGPIHEKMLKIDSIEPISIETSILGNMDFVHIRLILTPKKSDLPGSGKVSWTITPTQ